MRSFQQKSKDLKRMPASGMMTGHGRFGQHHEVNSLLRHGRMTEKQGVQQFHPETNGILSGDTPTSHQGLSFLPAAPQIQMKPEISTPGDDYEQEADHVAEQVMAMPEEELESDFSGG